MGINTTFVDIFFQASLPIYQTLRVLIWIMKRPIRVIQQSEEYFGVEILK